MGATIRGKIEYTIDKDHPDIKFVPDWTANKVFTYEDKYVFNDAYSEDDMWNYIKTDLALVAGGGYNADHIHNIKYTIGY